METRFETLANLMKDAEVAQKLLSCSPEEAMVILNDQYHLEFTAEELCEVARGIKAGLQDESDELSCEDMENVVGGAKGKAYYAGYYIGKTVQVAGTALGIVGGLVAVGAISW